MDKEKKIHFCPVCGYGAVAGQGNGIYYCPKCADLFLVSVPVVEGNASDTWHDIVGFEGFYQINDRLQVRSMDRVSSCGHRLHGKPVATYFKNNAIYVSLYRDSWHREYNVRYLWEKAVALENAKASATA